MKTAVDKNESELDKLKREALEWMEKKNVTFPPIIKIALEAYGKQRTELILTDEIKKQLLDRFGFTEDGVDAEGQLKIFSFIEWYRNKIQKLCK